jgi:hypothetical protein
LQLESPQTLLNNIITQKLYALPADYWDTYHTENRSDHDEVQRVAKKYLDLSRLQIVAVEMPAKSMMLKQYGRWRFTIPKGSPQDWVGKVNHFLCDFPFVICHFPRFSRIPVQGSENEE